jgi:hypothetical protein
MAFLNPLALIGLIAAGIPIIIHLFNFRKPRRVDFSSLTFLRELRRSTMRKLRIKQWLLLLLRTLIIACLVLAFARPTIRGSFVGGLAPQAKRSVAIVIDNSLSMSARNQNGDLFSQAREAALALIQSLSSEDEVLVTATAPPFTARPTTNLASASARVDDLRMSPLAIDPRPAVAHAGRLLSESRHPNRELYVLSDFQRAPLVKPLEAEIGEDIQIALIPIQGTEPSNVAVEAARVLTRIVEIGQPVEIEASVRNYSDRDRAGYAISVFLSGERVAQQVIDLAANAHTSVRFTFTPRERGWLTGAVRGEEDGFAFDDERSFVLHIPEVRDVLLVAGSGASIEYVSLVVSSGTSGGTSPFLVSQIAEKDLSTARFAAYDAVILVGPTGFSSGEVAALSDYVDQGGGVLLFLGPDAESQGYASLLERLKAGRIAGFSGDSGSGSAIASLDRFEAEHPLFYSIFDTGETDRVRLEHPEVYRSARYQPGSGDEQTLLWMSDGKPFLQEIDFGRGRVLLFTALPEPGWSELPLRGLFVPLIYRSLFYLTSGDGAALEAFVLGEDNTLRIPTADPTGLLRLISADGFERVPEQTKQFQSVLLTLPEDVEQPGTYEIRVDERLLRKVALNLSTRESDLTLVDEGSSVDIFEQTFGVEPVVFSETGSADELVTQVAASRSGVEIWNVFMVLALIFLVAEMLVAMRWRSDSEA